MKLLHMVSIAATALLLAADNPSQDAIPKDRELMAGTWSTISGESDGAAIAVRGISDSLSIRTAE